MTERRVGKVRVLLDLVRFEHSIFALPYAFIGALYAIYLMPGDAWLSRFHNAPFPGWIQEVGLVAWAGLGVWIYLHLTAAWRATSSQKCATASDGPADRLELDAR